MRNFFLSVLITCFTYLSAWCQSPAESFNENFLAEKHLAKEELLAKMKRYDFSAIWTATENSCVYGFIGANYQRIRIKFSAIKKDPANSADYIVSGKSMVKNTICKFTGKFIITSIRKHIKTHYGVDDELKGKGITGEYTIKGNYILLEDSTQKNTGIFKGIFQTEFYTTADGKIHYDDINIYSDGFINNQFTGSWISYSKKQSKVCNWGDYRIPKTSNFDIGAGDFSPDDKFLPFGWQSIRDFGKQGEIGLKAKNEENRIWWR